MELQQHERDGLKQALDKAKQTRNKAISKRRENMARQEKRNRQGAKEARQGGIPKILLGGRRNNAEITSGHVNTDTLNRLNDSIRKTHEALQELKADPIMFAELIGSGIPSQKLVAEAVGFNVRFKDWLYPHDLDFSWRGNIRLAINGSNGSGKSTLLKAILGSPLTTRGRLRMGNLKTLYLDQQCGSLHNDRTVLENIQAVCNLRVIEIRNALAQFLFTGESVFQIAGSLSGGERLRAALALGFLQQEKPELLLLDEPTNNLDLANIEFLENLICKFPGAVIAVSHDAVFLKNCKIEQELVLSPNSLLRE